MEDIPELVDFAVNVKLERLRKQRIYSIISNVILILVIVGIGTYIYMNIESFKMLGQDVCALCMNKTGVTCFKP